MKSIEQIMKESGIEIDDIRWYLSLVHARRLAELKERPGELVQYIHSKEMEADLYDMEQRYLDELQDSWDKRQVDEAYIREILYRINREKNRRREGRVMIERNEEGELK